MLERIKHEKTVDIYGHVTLMRAQRNYMVQTEDQYVFIHDALQEAVNCGTTEVPARNLYAYIQKLTQIEGGENVTGMELEFKVQTVEHWAQSFGSGIKNISSALALGSNSTICVLHIIPVKCTATRRKNLQASHWHCMFRVTCWPQHHWLAILPPTLFQFPVGPPDSVGPVVSSLFQLDDSLVQPNIG